MSAQPAPSRTIEKGDQSNIDSAKQVLVRTDAEWTALWRQHSPDRPKPKVDFSKEMVVVAAMGQKPSSGYWTFIDGACEVDGQLEVFVSNVDDVSCIGALAVVTYPADAVRLPQTNLPIVFRETSIPCLQWARQIGFK